MPIKATTIELADNMPRSRESGRTVGYERCLPPEAYRAREGDLTAVVLGRERLLTYRQLSERVATMAGRLVDGLALQAGDRVALIMKNCPEYVELMFACWHAGVTAVPINAKLHAREFEFILEHSGAKVCLVGNSVRPPGIN